ncbi:MAG: FIST C-terminal domain-containing protein [Candidatus Omnitrophica bacterium]|nr:FIST C-terminal domain-containing protein [Candidatus Omnitrophota bacterium]
MQTWVGVGWSQEAEAFKAGQQACAMAKEQLRHPTVHLALVFASSYFDQAKLLRGVRTVVAAPLVGGSSAGEILSSGTRRRSVVVMLLGSDELNIHSASVGLSAAPREAGQRLAHELFLASAHQRRLALLLFSDGLSPGHHEVIRGAQEIAGTVFPIIGGLTADDWRFTATSQYFQDQVLHDSVVGVLITGGIKVQSGCRHGWLPIGKPRRVTEARGNVLCSLDGEPAAKVYEEYFGEEAVAFTREEVLARMTISYPLGMYIAGEEEYLLRNVLQMDERGALVCTGEVEEGAVLRLMLGSQESAIEAARQAAKEAVARLREIRCVVVFDSVARQKLLGRLAEEEIRVIHDAIGADVPLIGCYTYGEQAPLRAAMGRSYLHNETVLVVALGV